MEEIEKQQFDFNDAVQQLLSGKSDLSTENRTQNF